MKKRLLIIISILTVLAVIVAVANISLAGGTGCDLELNPFASTVNPGNEFELTLKIKDITVTEGVSGILLGNLVYDSTAFEYQSYEIVSTNWKEVQSTDSTIKKSLTTKNGQGAKADENLVKIKFKVKPGATAKSYVIKFAKAESKPVEANVTQEFQSPISATITVSSSVNPTNNTVDNTLVNNTVVNNTVTNNAVVNNTVVNNTVVNNAVNNNAVTNNAVINANSSNSIVPFTGVKVGLGLGVFVAMVAALAAGIRYKKFNSIK